MINMVKNTVSKSVLEDFLKNNTFASGISKENIESSVIEIKSSRSHIGNAILISDNGYFVTALHCLEPRLKSLGFYDLNGIKYTLAEICETEPADDLVLAKLNKDGPSTSRQYNLQLDESATLHKPIMHLSRWNGKLVIKEGTLKSQNSYLPVELPGDKLTFYPDHASAKMKIINGDSGGAVINAKGDLLGLLCSGGKFSASYAESDNIIRLIQKYVAKNQQN